MQDIKKSYHKEKNQAVKRNQQKEMNQAIKRNQHRGMNHAQGMNQAKTMNQYKDFYQRNVMDQDKWFDRDEKQNRTPMRKQRWLRYVSIWNLQSKFTMKWLGILILLLGGIQGGFLAYNYQTGKFFQDGKYYRLEHMMKASYVHITFWIGLAVWVFVLLTSMFRQYHTSNADITYWRLPLRLKTIENIKILHTFAMLFLYVAAQFFLLILWSFLYRWMVPEAMQLSNALFLAMLRWEFLYHVFPIFDGINLLVNVSMLVFLAVQIEYIQCMYQFGKEKPVPILILLVGAFFLYMKTELWMVCLLAGGALLLSVFNYVQMRVVIAKEGRD